MASKASWIRAAAVASSLSCPSIAAAQALGGEAMPAVRGAVDANGVDVITGQFAPPVRSMVRIGSGSSGLSLDSSANGVSSLNSTIRQSDGFVIVKIGSNVARFRQNGSSFVSTEGDGATLTILDNAYVFSASDGTKAVYDSNFGQDLPFANGEIARLRSIQSPDGVVLTVKQNIQRVCKSAYVDPSPNPENLRDADACNSAYYIARVEALESTSGFALRVQYVLNSSSLLSSDNVEEWSKVKDVVAINQAEEVCPSIQPDCEPPDMWPRQSTTALEAFPVTVTKDESGRVVTATRRGAVYNYSYSDNGNQRTTTVTGPDGASSIYLSDLDMNRVFLTKDSVSGVVTQATYDGNGRLERKIDREGNYVQYTRDVRGNIREVKHVAKPGSGEADITILTGYPLSCVNALTCNKPTFELDALRNRTDYFYDGTHGGVTRIVFPSPTVGTPRPEVRYTYTSLQGYLRTPQGGMKPNGGPRHLVTQITSCAIASTCSGSASERVLRFSYDHPNLLLTSVSEASGDGTVNVVRKYAYDRLGNVIAIDGPLPGATDTSNLFYRWTRLRGVIGPDPDGQGSRPRVAERYLHDPFFDRILSVERGTVKEATEAALDAMVARQVVKLEYNAVGLKVRETGVADGSTISIVQFGYDARSRLRCTAVRMNLSSTPADACTPGVPGDQGPDRITRYSYNNFGQPTLVETAVGTVDRADEMAFSYTPNGRIGSVTDGEGNLTSYAYDGFDRRIQTRFPVANVGARSSNSEDFEQFVYDVAGRVIGHRLRDGQNISLTYDRLGRVTDRNAGGMATQIAYDLAGRPTVVSADGQRLTFTYDALGRRLLQGGSIFGTASAYDAAGRRVRLTHQDGNFFVYDFDVLGNVTAIRENGAATGVRVLAKYIYNDLGQRTQIMYGNGSVERSEFDAAGRLTQLAHDLPGTAHDSLTGFTYNPAGQISNASRSNSIYAWQGHINVDKSYTVNGLNQILTSGPATFAYDPRGNLLSDGSANYSYSIDDQLIQSSINDSSLRWDPIGRLAAITGKSPNSSQSRTTQFGYDGLDLIAELDTNGVLQRRYVHGASIDEPIVWYEGTGLGDRRFLQRDERGGVVSIANGEATVMAVNTYDEYGVPGTANLGRFQYTGQVWLAELGLYQYRARTYSPELGRFLQTDPIGYGDGMNVYAYVSSDPVNLVDPLGQEAAPPDEPEPEAEIVVTGERVRDIYVADAFSYGPNGILSSPRTPSGSVSRPKPDFCSDRDWKDGERISSFGSKISSAGLILAGTSWWTGVGAGFGSGVASVGGAITFIGASRQVAAGDRGAIGRGFLDAVGGRAIKSITKGPLGEGLLSAASDSAKDALGAGPC